VILQPILCNLLRRQTCCFAVAGKLHLKDALAAKSDININKTKSVKNARRCRDSRSAINRETGWG